jgi:molybdenum cofactor synthesis domain-containing protein
LFRKLVSVDEAKRVLARSFTPRPVGSEVVALSEAYGRVLADDVVSSFDIPPFNRSTVDGYAVKASDTFGADENCPVTLRLTGTVKVGEAPKARVQKGTLVEIVTGAPIPEGADAVVMIEYTERKGDSVLARQAVSHGENVMKAGSDIRKGEIVLRKGTMLSPYEIGALAAVGSVKARVYKRPIVAIFSTGAEVIEPGKSLTPGKIFDINAHALSAAVGECGCEPRNMGIVQDELDQMKTALQKALKTADLVITSGGVSVGPTDIIPKVLSTLGKPGVVVYGIAIRPGKPTTIALVDGIPVFSLPGHPASSLMTFHLFVRPLLICMAGRREQEAVTVKSVVSERLFPSRGRRTYVTVTLRKDRGGRIVALPVSTGLSGAITTLSKADGFLIIPEDQQFVEKGACVEVELFKPNTYYSLMRGETK